MFPWWKGQVVRGFPQNSGLKAAPFPAEIERQCSTDHGNQKLGSLLFVISPRRLVLQCRGRKKAGKGISSMKRILSQKGSKEIGMGKFLWTINSTNSKLTYLQQRKCCHYNQQGLCLSLLLQKQTPPDQSVELSVRRGKRCLDLRWTDPKLDDYRHQLDDCRHQVFLSQCEQSGSRAKTAEAEWGAWGIFPGSNVDRGIAEGGGGNFGESCSEESYSFERRQGCAR